MIDERPSNEAKRLVSLREYRAMDTPPEDCFDRVTRVVAHLLDTPLAFLTLIDEERAFVKSSVGAGNGATPRNTTFCTHAVESHDPLIVPDASIDPRFSSNPFVLGPPGLRFYAGAPLITPGGFCIGMLCGADLQPRAGISDKQRSLLVDLAGTAMEHIEHRLAKLRADDYAAALETREREFREALNRCDRSEARASLALEAGEMGYWEWDAATDRKAWSPRMDQILGVAPGSFDGTFEGWLKYVYAGDREQVVQDIHRNRRAKTPFFLKYRVQRPDGQLACIIEKGSYELDREGRILGASGITWDASQREKWLLELRASEESFRGLSLACPAGIFKARLDGQVTYVNRTTAAIWGMAEDELLGYGWVSRLHPEDSEALLQGWTRANEQRVSFEYEYRLLMPDGSVRWVHGRSAIVHAEDGDSSVGTVDDITARKETTAALESAKAEAERANRAKDLFLASVSHELRTPLNGILGMSELLLQSTLEERQRESAEMIQRSGKTLLTLVNDVLDTSKIGAGTMTIEKAPFDLRAAVDLAANFVRSDAEAKGLTVLVHCASGLPARLVGDGNRIQQIVLNFLTNAVKFTDSGSIRCEVRCESARPDHCKLKIEVRDSGLGISAEAQKRLFQPFSQVDSSSTRKQRGVGLGLAICRQLAELMGGTVGVSSIPGAGSTFWLELELPVVAEELRVTGTAPAIQTEIETRGRILVAEDNPINQRVVLRMLEKLGWDVDIAPNGVRAIALAREKQYAMVLMDCLMPEADGYTATTQIRQHEQANSLPRLPIVALTANALSGDRERCLDAGMDDYLSKPLQLHLLQDVLRRWSFRASRVESPVG